MPQHKPVAKRRKELERLLRSLKGLNESLKHLSIDSYVDLLDQSEKSTNFLNQKVDVNVVADLQIEATKLANFVSATIGGLQSRKGRAADDPKRFLAILIASEFRSQNLAVTSYDDGPYMKVLEVLFRQIYPEAKKAGYIRHGKWAISQFPSN